LEIKRFTLEYITRPFVVWAIIFYGIIQFAHEPEVSNFIKWIQSSQIYLVIFFTSFVFSYSQQMLPVFKSMREIRIRQRQNRWTVPHLMTNRIVLNIALWLSAVLFFSGILMSFGILYPESIPDHEKYSQTRTLIYITGFILFGVALYYSWEFERILKKYEIDLDKESSLGIMISVLSLTFFITLSYVATIGFGNVSF